MDPIIELQNISVRYQGVMVLQNVSLKIFQGEYVGIFGPNGSGKTTLLKTILGIKEAFQGKVLLFNKPNKDKSVKSYISYVPQNPSVIKSFPATVLEVVEMGLYGRVGFLKPLKEEHIRQAEEALHKVYMGSYKNRPIGHLSGGELQKVMVARALASNPKVILLDEPTSSLDFVMTKDLMELLLELNKKYNITIIVIHHHIDLLLPYCSRLILMNKKIVYDGKPDNKTVNEKIREIFNYPLLSMDSDNHD